MKALLLRKGARPPVKAVIEPASTGLLARMTTPPPKGFLLDVVASEIMRQDERDNSYLHCSEAKDYCPRFECYQYSDISLIKPKEKIDLMLAWTFNLGHAIHHTIQDALGRRGTLLGRWRCQGCNGIEGGDAVSEWIPKPSKCSICGHARFDFRECFAFNESLRIGGSIDGGFRWPDGRVSGLEIKSVSERGFNSLTDDILEEHELQAQLYMALFGLDYQTFLYTSKGWHRGAGDATRRGPFKEIIYKRDDALANDFLVRRKEGIEGMTGGPLPRRIPACSNKFAGRVKECPAASLCFKE